MKVLMEGTGYMKIKDSIRIREEDGFFLLINLNEESILKGYPSFFKINRIGKEIIDFMREDVTIDEIMEYCISKSPSYKKEETSIMSFVDFLRKADLTCE